MGQLIRFPVPAHAPIAATRRAKRIFQAQQQMRIEQRREHLLFAAAAALAASLLALGQLLPLL
jgi:hypothetical protein